jgi:hypothetical protein
LSLLQCGPRALEDRRGIGHRCVEEEPEEGIAEIVVSVDVAPATGPGIGAGAVAQAGQGGGRARRTAAVEATERGAPA